MPDIKLGPAGSETTLPDINWKVGQSPSLPVGLKKNVNKSVQVDGSVRVHLKENHQRTFPLRWAKLTETEVETIDAIVALNQKLHYQNNWINADWIWVTVQSWNWEPIQSTFASTPYFQAQLSLAEVS